MKLSMLELTLLAALESIVPDAELNMRDENGKQSKEEKQIIRQAKAAIALAHRTRK